MMIERTTPVHIIQPAQVDQSQWPLPTYVQAWKAFRSVSNEAEAIANHIIGQKWVPKKTPINVLDVGTGDGVLLQKILLLCNSPIQDVNVVDPNPAFLAEARSHLVDLQIGGQLRWINKKIEDVDRDLIRTSDVVIFSHAIYLTGVSALMRVLKQLDSGACCYVVFDAADSIFSRLWEKTAAPEYLTRVQKARSSIEAMPAAQWEVRKTTIITQVKNPCRLRPKISERVKSLLCYTDVEDLDKDTLNWVNAEIEKAGRFGDIQCSSDCYELIRQ